MLECRTCLARCIRAIVGEANPRLQRISPRPGRSPRGIRTYTAEPRRDVAPARPRAAQSPYEDWVEKPAYDPKDRANGMPKKTYSVDQAVIRKNQQRQVSDDNRDARLPNMTLEMERKLKKELVWLKDPLKLAEHVRHTLRANDVQKALGLCRLASRDMQAVVGWNHCIGWLLAQKRANEALKIYNEMKKRAQFPDSHTYVILLRGLSEPPMHAETVGKALSIYHSLAAPNSRVRQTTLHTNAALRVCARAHDMDSLWGVAAKIPEHGPAAADGHTFAVILNAVRESVLFHGGRNVDDSHVASMRAQAMLEGRRVWADIVAKWRAGDVVVQEELTCAMGRLLLEGLRPRDWDDVLSLIEQAMDIPRLIPRMGTKMRHAEHLYVPPSLRADVQPDADGESPPSEFDKSLVLDRRGGGSVSFAKPGNNSLSLILEACLKMAAPKAATEYWRLLTDATGYDVKPDMDNLHMYLRILRLQRASFRTCEVVEHDFPRAGLVPVRKTWRIAMSACRRDKNNPNSFKHANSLMDLMAAHGADADAKTLVLYLDLAIASQRGDVILAAITRLGPSITELKSKTSFGNPDIEDTPLNDKNDVALLVRTAVGALDQVILKHMIPADEAAVWSKRRSRLAEWVTRFSNRMQGNVIPRERVRAFRRESRTLRHLRHNSVRREKRADGTWVDRKKTAKRQDDELLDFSGEF